MYPVIAERTPVTPLDLSLSRSLAVHVDELGSRILDAAFEQYCEFGVHKSTMEDIAARAKVSRVTVYRRFPNRDAVLGAVIARELASLMDRLDAVGSSDIDSDLVEGFVATMAFTRAHPLLRRLLATEGHELLRAVTVDGAPLIQIARSYLTARLVHRRPSLSKRRRAVEQLAELVIRLCLSLILTPGGALQVTDDREARAFANRWLLPLLHSATRPARRSPA